MNKSTQKGFIIPILIAIIVILIAGGTYFALKNKPASSVSDTSAQPVVVSTPNMSSTTAQGMPVPVITSIYPTSGPIGTVVQIKGTGLSGLEGDLDVYFERQDGKKVLLTDTSGDYAKTADKLITVIVKEPCQQGETVYGSYSGIPKPCDYVQLTPGTYKIYTMPWGEKSNVVSFTITSGTNNVISKTAADKELIKGWSNYSDESGSITFKAPSQFTKDTLSAFDKQQGTVLGLSIGNNYFQSIAATGTILTGWHIDAGKSGAGCSVQNVSPVASATSTNIININGNSFYQVSGYDHGAGSEDEVISYVHLMRGTDCRYISFHRHSAVYGTITGSYPAQQAADISATDSKIDENIKSIIPVILSTLIINY